MSKKKALRAIRIPEFSYGGFRVPEVEVAIQIENLGTQKPAYQLHKGSTTLAEATSIYQLALAAPAGETLEGKGAETLKAVLSVYDDIHLQIGMGVWTDDACDYNNGKRPKGVLIPDGFVPIRWVKRPFFRKEWDRWVALSGEDSEEMYVFLPPDGFVVPTVDGLYRPDTGTPFATEKNRREAVRLLDKAGLDGNKEVSYVFRREQHEDIRAVFHRHYGDSFGPLAISICAEPSYTDLCIGSRPLSRVGRPVVSGGTQNRLPGKDISA